MAKTNFRKVVNIPHKELAKKIKGINENEHPQTNGEKIKKGAKIAGLGVLEFISFAIKYGVFDNQLTRKLEKVYAEMKVGKNEQGQDKKFSSFIKKHPEFSSYMTWWLAILMVIGVAKGGKFLKEFSDSDEKEGEKIENTISYADDAPEKNTFGEYKQKILSGLVNKQVLLLAFEEGAELNKEKTEIIVYQKNGDKVTHDYGTTIDPNGKPWKLNAKNHSFKEAWAGTANFIENQETLFLLYCYDLAFGNYNPRPNEQTMAIASALYNIGGDFIENSSSNRDLRWKKLRELYKAKGDKITRQEILDLFKRYPINSFTKAGKALSENDMKTYVDRLGQWVYDDRKMQGGLVWRRWVEAMLITGDLTLDDIKNLPAACVSDFYEACGNSLKEKREAFFKDVGTGHSVLNKDLIKKFWEWLPGFKKSHPSRGTVFSIVDSEISKKIEEGIWNFHIENGVLVIDNQDENGASHVILPEDMVSLDFAKYSEQAQTEYNNGNYDKAIKLWLLALNEKPTDAQIMDNLAVAYIRNEQYNMALNILSKIIAGGYTEQFKYAYYNIGTAYEGLGQIEDALSAYKNAKKYGNSAAAKKISDLEGKTKKGKKTAYIQGSRRLNSKGYNVRKYTPQKRGMA